MEDEMEGSTVSALGRKPCLSCCSQTVQAFSRQLWKERPHLPSQPRKGQPTPASAPSVSISSMQEDGFVLSLREQATEYGYKRRDQVSSFKIGYYVRTRGGKYLISGPWPAIIHLHLLPFPPPPVALFVANLLVFVAEPPAAGDQRHLSWSPSRGLSLTGPTGRG